MCVDTVSSKSLWRAPLRSRMCYLGDGLIGLTTLGIMPTYRYGDTSKANELNSIEYIEPR